MVNYDEYKKPEEGTKSKTVIKEINEGLAEDFRSPEYWEAVKDKDTVPELMKQQVIELVMENGAQFVITLPANKIISPKSNLAAFKKTYGKYPEIGDEVSTKIDENGFNKLVLEK